MLKKLHLLFCLVILLALVAPAVCWAYADELQVGGDETTGFYYTVQKGDTLWSIAKKFEGTPWTWKGIYENNAWLNNPNEIYPGQVLQLYRKPGNTPEGYIGAELSSDIIFYYPNIDGLSFVRKTPVRPAGTVFWLDDRGTISGALNDRLKIYIAPEAKMEIGNLLTVYRPMQSANYKFGRAMGEKYEILAIAEIMRFDGGIAEIRIRKAYHPVKTGDLVVYYTPRQQEIPVCLSNSEVEGIVFASDNHYSIMSNQMVAFVDKGSRDGMQPGQFYTLYETVDFVTAEPQPATDNLLRGIADLFNSRGVRNVSTRNVVGEFIVLHSENDSSTVYILNSLKPIMEGTKFRAYVY